MENITLIGMPSAGKSVIGVLLAKRLGYEFVDTDLVIQKEEGKLLKEIIAESGLDGFAVVENRVNSRIQVHHAVIAPGGSVVYGAEAMEHLKAISTVVYLKISYETLEKRLGNLQERGVVIREGMTLRDLYEERVPLYEKYADLVLEEGDMDAGACVDLLRRMLR